MVQILTVPPSSAISNRFGPVMANRRCPKEIKNLTDAESAVKLLKGEMGAFQLGSTVINLFPKKSCTTGKPNVSTLPVRMGEVLAYIKIILYKKTTLKSFL